MSDTIRAFIAIELPEKIISHIKTVQDGIKSCKINAGWVNPKNIHLTLKFLGNIKREDTEKVTGAMTQAVKEFLLTQGNQHISLSAKGIGVFPNIKKARVIWIGLKGDTFQLIGLQKILDNNLEKSGFPKEERDFKAHLTLARIKDKIDPEKLAEAMKKFGEAESDTFEVDKIILFKSDLKPGGAVYTKLAETVISEQLSVISA